MQAPRSRTFQVSPGQELLIAGGFSPHSWIMTHNVYIFSGSLQILTKVPEETFALGSGS